MDEGNRREVAGNPGKHADAPDQLLQLPDEMRRNDFRPGNRHLHDEMLHKTDVHDGGLFGPGFWIQDRSTRTEYGVDGFSAPQVMAFALELHEAGILKDQDMQGMPSDSEGKFYWLLDRIVRREGIGDVLANGTYWAAKQIGNGAEEYAHNNIKKQEQLPLKLGMLNPVYFLMYSTGEKINITQIEGQFPQAPFLTKEETEEFMKDWIQVPDEKFKDYLRKWEMRGEFSNPNYPGCSGKLRYRRLAGDDALH